MWAAPAQLTAQGSVRLAFGAVDGGVRGEINHQIGRLPHQYCSDRSAFCDVDSLSVERQDCVAGKPSRATNFAPDLSARAKHDNLHLISGRKRGEPGRAG